MIKLRNLSAIALLIALGVTANADAASTVGALIGSDDGRPSRGMTQTSVESKYGSPVSIVAAVGEPPISRWVYADFVVYFEYDRVIHAVLKR